tara:strand:- start:454 stop:723 length:270 start_codon:yes stop_codon:yes gene_type:complete
MTKDDMMTRVGMGFFSCKWINNKGDISRLKRGILGKHAWRRTNLGTRDSIKENTNYVLAYRVGNGLNPNHRKWVSINPNTIIELNGRTV